MQNELVNYKHLLDISQTLAKELFLNTQRILLQMLVCQRFIRNLNTHFYDFPFVYLIRIYFMSHLRCI